MPKVADPSRVLFDTDWQGGLEDQIRQAIDSEYRELVGIDHPGVLVATNAIGRMSIANELLVKASRLRGTPILDAPTSWKYLSWKLEYDAARKEKADNLADLHVLAGLQNLASGEMQWLGKVPTKALIELRQVGALDEIRGILGKGIEELAEANPANFHRTSDLIFENIHEAFDRHQKNIKALRDKKLKFAGSDVGSWLVVGTLAITAAATGLPVWGLAAIIADQVLDAPKLKDIPQSIRKLAKDSKELKESPVGLLFSYRHNR